MRLLLRSCPAREDIRCDAVRLQQRAREARVETIVQANLIDARAQRNETMAGLRFPEINGPCPLASMADASHGSSVTACPR